MNIRKKITFSIACLFTLLNAVSQEFHDPRLPLTAESNTLNYKLTGRQYYFHSTLQGSVYLNDDWVKGSVTLENGDKHEDVYLKLNTLSEELITHNERVGSTIIIDKYIIDEFNLKNDKSSSNIFRKLNFDEYPKGEHYFNVLYENELTLLCWYRTIEETTSYYRDSYGYLRDTWFKQESVYLLLLPDNNLVRIKGTKRSLINLFPEQKRKIRRLLRRNRINFSSESSAEITRAVKLIETEFFQ